METLIDARSEAEALAKVDELLAIPGMTVTICDCPEKAQKGFLAYLTHENHVSDSTYIRWNIYGKPLEPEVEVLTDANALLECLQSRPEYVACDEPRQLMLGFAWYKPEENTAHIKHISIKHVRSAEHEVKQEILRQRGRLQYRILTDKVIERIQYNTNIVLDSASILADIIRDTPADLICDDPASRTIGFVWGNQVKQVRSVKLEDFLKANEADQKCISDEKARLKEKPVA